jgi:PAS domain S-box-containing protein
VPQFGASVLDGTAASAAGTLLAVPNRVLAPKLPVYRVLIVDDVEEERELLRARLEDTRRFVVVGEAEDGPRGVAMTSELRPDLVTLDMSMPGGNGFAALKLILANCPESKVVIVSGYVTDELVHASVDSFGAAACLDKRIGFDLLVQVLLNVVEPPSEAAGSADEPPAVADTAQAAAHDEFLASRLAAIVESSEDAIIGKTLDGTVTSWNAGAEHLYGYSADEMVGQNISLLIPHDAGNELSEALRRVRRGERIKHHETRRVRKDHSFVDVSLAISPILDGDGVVVGLSTIARDVTARKLADVTELTRQAQELRRSNEELEQFAYVASHDLSEPLRTISGYVELLARRYGGELDADADRFIQHTVDGCGRMRQLIDDLLAYSRAGHTVDLSAAVDCSSVAEEVRFGMAAALDESGGQVDFDHLPTVRGDRAQITQLFQNLVANAVKFARPGVPPRVLIEAHGDGGEWIFSVTDNGIGIDPEYRDRIFGMFQRLHARDSYPGTGIGLAICMRIVRAHRGEIWVADTPDEGTRFCFSLTAAGEGPRS